MNIPEMIEFCDEQIQGTRRGMDAAHSTGNYQLAALNCRQAFKLRLMKGLIEWRIGTDPSDSLHEVVSGFAADWATVSTVGGSEAKTADVPAERVAFVSYLIGVPSPIYPTFVGLENDRILDFVLGDWLVNASFDEGAWKQGMNQLRRMGRRAELAVQTFELYKAIAHAAGADLSVFSHEGEKLFTKRKSDSYFSGADQTEGGGEDNSLTVDYRLAALLKHAGIDNASSMHVWKW